jgi:hypothetical protein
VAKVRYIGRLKKELKPPLNKYWCIPPKANAFFVAEVHAWLF